MAASLALLVAGLVAISAAPSALYYAPAEGKTGAALRQALHGIIRNHNVIPYSSSTKLDTADALKVLDEDPANTNNVWLPYAQRSAPKSGFGLAAGWNREHQWCNSYGLDDVEPAYSDLHNLRAEDENVNSARGNKFYDVSDPSAVGYKKTEDGKACMVSKNFTASLHPKAKLAEFLGKWRGRLVVPGETIELAKLIGAPNTPRA